MPTITSSDGIEIYYETEGEGPPLLLVHGLAMGADSWRGAGYIDALSGAFNVVAIELRGHGRSAKPHDAAAYAAETMVDDVLAVLDANGIDRSHV